MVCSCGKENCNGVCNYAVGKRLSAFIREVDTVGTKIGDVDNKNSRDSLIVIGTNVYSDGSQSTILKKAADISIPIEDRFSNYNGKNARALLREYVTISGIADGNELINKLRDIEDNKLMLVPLKTKQICDVKHTRISRREEVNGTKIDCRTSIESIKWSIVGSTEKLQCYLTVSMVDPDTNKKLKFNLTDYCSAFNLVDMERLNVKSKLVGKLIEMTKFGFIKPIQIDKGNTTIIIDNCSVYMRGKDEDELRIIGSWGNHGIEYDERIKDEKINKALAANEDYIGKHRRWIAPYGLHETNKLVLN